MGRTRKGKARLTSAVVHTGEPSSTAWFCYEHACWNSDRRRLCLCKRPPDREGGR